MPREFDTVSVGDELPSRTIEVTRAMLVSYANASGDQNPIHQDEEFATGVGLPNVIAHGMWTMGAAGTVVADWAGDAGRIREYGTRFTNMVVVPSTGAAIEVSGKVIAVNDEDRSVSVELTVTADGAKVLGRARATVDLAT